VDVWPTIAEPELLARLTMSDEDFVALATGWAKAIEPREFTEELFAHGLAYPWTRPDHSYLLTGDRVERIHALPEADAVERFPLLAIGANGAPDRLTLRFAQLPDAERRVVVVAGDLHDFDVGPAAAVTTYGSLPATIFPSHGTAVRVQLLWVTAAQLGALTATEISYRLGRLDGIRFVPDLDDAPEVDAVFALVSRWGAHCVGGEPVALAAVPAAGRFAPALTQEQLLDHVATTVLGGDARARDVVRAVTEDFATMGTAIVPVLLETARPFRSERWTPYPAPRVGGSLSSP
jgi:hypothetical protein